MSEKEMKLIEQICGPNADKLNEEEKAFVKGFVARATLDVTANKQDDRKDD